MARVAKDAQAFKVDVERRQQAGLLYEPAPERFGTVAQAWLERYEKGPPAASVPALARSARPASSCRSWRRSRT